MEKYQLLQAIVDGLAGDVAKVAAGNKAARTRVRVGLQEVKKLSQLLRVEINNLD